MKYKVSIQESSLTDDFDIFIEISEPFNVSVKRNCKDQELLKMYKENPKDVDKIFEREAETFKLYKNQIGFFGDMHPEYEGTVVKALASVKNWVQVKF